MKKWLVISVSLVLILGLLLSGCSQPAPSTTAAPATSKAPAPASSSAPATSAAPAPSTSAAASPAGQVFKIKMTAAASTTQPTNVQLQKSVDILKTKSNGRLQVDFYQSGVLFPEAQYMESCANNVVQISMGPTGTYWNNLGIVYDVRFLPFGFDPKAFGAHWREKGGFLDFAEPYFEKAGLKLLNWSFAGGTEAFFTKPAKTLEDIKGRVVAAPAGTGTQMCKLLGMTPTALLGPDMLLAVQKGTIDGNMGSSESSENGYGMYDYIKYEIDCSFWEGNTPIVCNLQWFNSLPADLQQLVVSTYSDLEAAHYANYDGVIKADRDQVLKAGVQIYTLPTAEKARWAALIKPIYDDIAKKYPAEWQKFLDATTKVRIQY